MRDYSLTNYPPATTKEAFRAVDIKGVPLSEVYKPHIAWLFLQEPGLRLI